MSMTIAGIVKDGVVVPGVPLPEGAHVVIHWSAPPPGCPPELWEELADWQQASANALNLVERLAHESDADEKR